MSDNTTALKAALIVEINGLDDPLAKAEALVLCDRYIAAVEGQSSVESGAVQSYTIAGRTVTRRNMAEGQSLVYQLRAQLYDFIGGPVSYVSMGGYA